jgi:hypothetical protein
MKENAQQCMEFEGFLYFSLGCQSNQHLLECRWLDSWHKTKAFSGCHMSFLWWWWGSKMAFYKTKQKVDIKNSNITAVKIRFCIPKLSSALEKMRNLKLADSLIFEWRFLQESDQISLFIESWRNRAFYDKLNPLEVPKTFLEEILQLGPQSYDFYLQRQRCKNLHRHG